MQTLYASGAEPRKKTGRSKPCVFRCEDLEGNFKGEYVVKLYGGVETGRTGILCEYVASELADYLGILRPEPAIVYIDEAFSQVIPDAETRQIVQNSIGNNFGSLNISGGYGPWIKESTIPIGLERNAIDIFCFDAFIQNPDRIVDNPNLLFNGSEIYIIDHETAFSYVWIPSFLLPPHLWKITELNLMESHVFFSGLRGKSINVENMARKFQSMYEDDIIQKIVSSAPSEWFNEGTENERAEKIISHSKLVLEHTDEFFDEIKRVLQ